METYFVWTIYAWNEEPAMAPTHGLYGMTPVHERPDFISISLVAKNEPDAKEEVAKRVHRDHYQAVGAVEYVVNSVAKSMDNVASAMEKCAGSEEQK